MNQSVVFVDVLTFLLSYVRKTTIEHLWIDIGTPHDYVSRKEKRLAEGSEYAIMHDLLEGGRVQRAGITVCQYNMEVSKYYENEITRLWMGYLCIGLI